MQEMPNQGMPNPEMPNQNMPSEGLYLFLVIVGFLCGCLWGILSISPYNKMKAAIAAGDAATAQQNAKTIRIFVIIGVVVNVLVLIGSLAAGS